MYETFNGLARWAYNRQCGPCREKEGITYAAGLHSHSCGRCALLSEWLLGQITLPLKSIADLMGYVMKKRQDHMEWAEIEKILATASKKCSDTGRKKSKVPNEKEYARNWGAPLDAEREEDTIPTIEIDESLSGETSNEEGEVEQPEFKDNFKDEWL